MGQSERAGIIRCPQCKLDGSLYEIVEVTAWRSVGADNISWGPLEEINADGHPEPTGEIGCGNCEWTGYRPHPQHDFERVPS